MLFEVHQAKISKAQQFRLLKQGDELFAINVVIRKGVRTHREIHFHKTIQSQKPLPSSLSIVIVWVADRLISLADAHTDGQLSLWAPLVEIDLVTAKITLPTPLR